MSKFYLGIHCLSKFLSGPLLFVNVLSRTSLFVKVYLSIRCLSKFYLTLHCLSKSLFANILDSGFPAYKGLKKRKLKNEKKTRKAQSFNA